MGDHGVHDFFFLLHKCPAGGAITPNEIFRRVTRTFCMKLGANG